jgi:hypothetical protein
VDSLVTDNLPRPRFGRFASLLQFDLSSSTKDYSYLELAFVNSRFRSAIDFSVRLDWAAPLAIADGDVIYITWR